MAKAKKYGPNGTAINGIIRGMRTMGIDPAGIKADGVAGAKFDEAVETAKQGTDETRTFLHLLMFNACVVNPAAQKVPMHHWSPEADAVIADLKACAAAEATAGGD